MASQDTELQCEEAPDEDIDLTKPYWIGYFRLPVDDVSCEEIFQPKYGSAIDTAWVSGDWTLGLQR